MPKENRIPKPEAGHWPRVGLTWLKRNDSTGGVARPHPDPLPQERLPRTFIALCTLEPTKVGRVSPLRAAIANRTLWIVPDGAHGVTRPALRFMESLHLPWHMHWDLEPWPGRSADSLVRQFLPLGSRGQSCPRSGRRFMGSLQSRRAGAHRDPEPDQSERRSPDGRLSLANVNRPNWSSAFRFMEREPTIAEARRGAKWFALSSAGKSSPSPGGEGWGEGDRCLSTGSFRLHRIASSRVLSSFESRISNFTLA
jgi:hypothetical protein